MPSPLSATPSQDLGKPISIRVGYQWKSREKGAVSKKPKSEGPDIWPFISKAVRSVIAECQKIRGRRVHGLPLKLDFGRLRARHATTVLGSIVQRICSCDILIFDLGDFNKNVLFELGCAVGSQGLDSRNIFILGTEKTLKELPSDLKGFFLTKYKRPNRGKKNRRDDKQEYSFDELRVFQTTLRGSISKLAQSRGTWGEPADKSEVIDDEVELGKFTRRPSKYGSPKNGQPRVRT